MNALNSLVKTIWIVMAALVVIGFLAADRFRLTKELNEFRQEVATLQTRMAQQAEQCRATQTQMEQALASEQTRRITAENQVAGLQQALEGERTQRATAESQVTELRQALENEQARRARAQGHVMALQQLSANQQSSGVCGSFQPRLSVANSQPQTKHTAVVSRSALASRAGIMALILLAVTLAGGALVSIRRSTQTAAGSSNSRPPDQPTQPGIRPLYLRRKRYPDSER